tara:strand:+ start:1567 stop:1830 length:264 start_codon:yes stop_codon:yes gene_type:complete
MTYLFNGAKMFYTAIQKQQAHTKKEQCYFLIERDGTVLRKKHRQSLEEDEIKNIIALTKEGKEVKVISKLLDLAESTVYRYRREANK